MTIHHDKLAYGKLASQSEELSEQDILAMLEQLNEQEEEEQTSSENNEPDKK